MTTALAFALVLQTTTAGLTRGVALAAPTDVSAIEAEMEGLVSRIDTATAAYTQATAEVDALAGEMAIEQQRLEDIERTIPVQRELTAQSVKNMYLLQQSAPDLLGLLLSAESFNDFLTTLRYVETIQEHNMAQIRALTRMREESQQLQAATDAQLQAALSRKDQALVALDEVRTARAELQQRKDALLAEAARAEAQAERERVQRAAAEAQARAQEALAALPAQVAAATTPPPTPTVVTPEQVPPATVPAVPQDPAIVGTEPAPPAPVVVPEPVAVPEPVVAPAPTSQLATSADTATWAARIDSYLAGSPLAGYGQTFADAALSSGIDPRLSPAISCIESSKGAVCFAPHNAWGWGSSGWGSWEEAIYAHASGLSSIYGPSIDLADAKMYAGDDIYLTWYSLLSQEMSLI